MALSESFWTNKHRFIISQHQKLLIETGTLLGSPSLFHTVYPVNKVLYGNQNASVYMRCTHAITNLLYYGYVCKWVHVCQCMKKQKRPIVLRCLLVGIQVHPMLWAAFLSPPWSFGGRLSLNLLEREQCIENPFSVAVTAILFHWIKWGQSNKSEDYIEGERAG